MRKADVDSNNLLVPKLIHRRKAVVSFWLLLVAIYSEAKTKAEGFPVVFLPLLLVMRG